MQIDIRMSFAWVKLLILIWEQQTLKLSGAIIIVELLYKLEAIEEAVKQHMTD